MITIIYSIMILCLLLVVAKCLIYINAIDKRINDILAEEIRQNKRIDMLEKRELVRQSEERRDKAFIGANELFKNW